MAADLRKIIPRLKFFSHIPDSALVYMLLNIIYGVSIYIILDDVKVWLALRCRQEWFLTWLNHQIFFVYPYASTQRSCGFCILSYFYIYIYIVLDDFKVCRSIDSAGAALLAALGQYYWQRWSSSIGSAGVILLATLEQCY